jgi:hypothetical protein
LAEVNLVPTSSLSKEIGKGVSGVTVNSSQNTSSAESSSSFKIIGKELPTVHFLKLSTVRQAQTQRKRAEPEATILLRPWLSSVRDSKYPKAAEEMLKEENLLSFYKCMGSNCRHSTNNFELFSCHLKAHEQLQLQYEDFKNCAYCEFKAETCTDLLMHLKSVHGNDKFSCTKCFYRSIAPENVCHHFARFHPNETLSMPSLDCFDAFDNAVVEVNKTRWKYVHQISCPGILNKFHIIKITEQFFYDSQVARKNLRSSKNSQLI